MKKLLLLSTIFAIITSCSFSKKPEFKYIDTIDVKNISMRNVTLGADAVFENPNHLKGKLSIEGIQIFVDNIEVGNIVSDEFDVPSKGEFTIPLQGTFSLSKIFKDHKKSILGSVLKIFQTDSLHVQYKGTIRYHLGDFSYPYNVDKKQSILLKQ